MVPFITASLPGPEAAKRPQTITLPPPYFTVGMMFFFWNAVTFTPDVMGHTPSKKFNFCLVSPQSIFAKVFGIIKMFSGKTEMSFYVLFAQQRFWSWNSAMQAIFAQSLSYGGVMNTDLNWGKWGLQFFKCCCGVFCDLLDESSLRSWGNFGSNQAWMWLEKLNSGVINHSYVLTGGGGQTLFHTGPCWFGFCFPFIKKTLHSKTACCVYLCYLWLIFKFVSWSETLKCDKHAIK